jgi:hypothetical protein
MLPFFERRSGCMGHVLGMLFDPLLSHSLRS